MLESQLSMLNKTCEGYVLTLEDGIGDAIPAGLLASLSEQKL